MYRFASIRVFWMLSIGLACGMRAESVRAQASAAAGKELTVERIYSAPSLSGHLTEGIEWTPDSKRISYIVRKGSGPDAPVELWTMDGATGERKMLVGPDTL
jgi:dipeptidyl-peptidase-4